MKFRKISGKLYLVKKYKEKVIIGVVFCSVCFSGKLFTQQTDEIKSPKFDLSARGYKSKMIMTATAYHPNCCGSPGGLTASGEKAQRGQVAVDPRVIPLGSILYIPTYGYAKASDVGGKIKGNKIDLCFDTREEVKNFGKRKVEVYILRKNLPNF